MLDLAVWLLWESGGRRRENDNIVANYFDIQCVLEDVIVSCERVTKVRLPNIVSKLTKCVHSISISMIWRYEIAQKSKPRTSRRPSYNEVQGANHDACTYPQQ